MNNPDLTEILNKEISDLVDLMHQSIKLIGKHYGLNSDQLSDIERDFIARLAFAAIKYGVEKEPEKEPEKKSEDLPEFIGETLSFIKEYCKEHDCEDCVFNEPDQCKLKYTPNEWEV